LIECNNCPMNGICTPFIKQFLMYYDYCDEFIERDFMEDVNEDNWSEFSYNKYTDTITDYGEPTDWDIFNSSED
jgi:hypothetical protein